MRSVACISVVVMHSPIAGGVGGEWFLAPRLFYARSVFITFFMISGALAFYKPQTTFTFVKSRLIRIGIPLLLWTILSLLSDLLLHTISPRQFVTKITLIPFGPQVRIYWFLYVLFGIYLLTPILSTWLARSGRREVEFYLLIFAVAMSMPFVSWASPDSAAITDVENGWLYYFSGFLGLAVAGYYLRRYVEIKRFRWWHAVVYLTLLALPAVFFVSPVPNNLIQSNLSIVIALIAVCNFLLIKHLPLPSHKIQRAAYNFGSHSFGIYLVHILVKQHLVEPIVKPLHLNYLIQIPVVVVLIIFFSYFIVHLISKLPHSKYIVGI